MLFSSITFIFYFLPIVLILHLLAPKSWKNLVVLVSSLFFYAWGEPKYVILMVITILLGYLAGLLIEKYRATGAKNVIVTLSLVTFLGMLGFFKYTDFLIDNVNSLAGTKIPLLKIALPIGISFYTFQMISYIVDVARGNAKAQRNIIKLAAYISMFPQLIAGPIVRYTDIEKQLDNRNYTLEKISYGIRRFVIGLGKKILIANTLGEIVAAYGNASDKTVLFAWLYAVSAALQIYFDFSGYSDMAIGLGALLGFDFPENFDHPYASKSVTEFWRRWHMTLGGWFRDYLYIPMGGNRVTSLRWIFNILVVWMATGLWHGASWNFVIWGLYFALFLVLEKKVYGKALEKAKFINHIYLLLVTIVSFVIFDSQGLAQIAGNLGAMLGVGGISIASTESLFVLKDYCLVLIMAFIGAMGLPVKIVNTVKESKNGKMLLDSLEPVFIAIVLLISVAFLINGSFNPFLYFRF